VPAPLFSQVTGLRRGRGPSDVTSMSRRRRRAFPASRGVVVLRVHVGPHRQGGVRVTEPGGDDRDGHALEVQERAAGVGSQPRRWCRRAGVVAAARTRRGTGRSGVAASGGRQAVSSMQDQALALAPSPLKAYWRVQRHPSGASYRQRHLQSPPAARWPMGDCRRGSRHQAGLTMDASLMH